MQIFDWNIDSFKKGIGKLFTLEPSSCHSVMMGHDQISNLLQLSKIDVKTSQKSADKKSLAPGASHSCVWIKSGIPQQGRRYVTIKPVIDTVF